MDVPELLEQAQTIRPELIVVSASSFDVHVADQFVAALRQNTKRAVLVIGIGQGYYSRGNKGKSNKGYGDYDAILLGEPEEAFFRLFNSIQEDHEVNREGWREFFRKRYLEEHKFLVTDPDSLPFPSYTAEELEAYRSISPVRMSKRVTWGYIIGMRG